MTVGQSRHYTLMFLREDLSNAPILNATGILTEKNTITYNESITSAMNSGVNSKMTKAYTNY